MSQTEMTETRKKVYAQATQVVAVAANSLATIVIQALKSERETALAVRTLEEKITEALDEFQQSLWPLKECDTCEGSGKIDDGLGGHGPAATVGPCPDCDGQGRYRP